MKINLTEDEVNLIADERTNKDTLPYYVDSSVLTKVLGQIQHRMFTISNTLEMLLDPDVNTKKYEEQAFEVVLGALLCLSHEIFESTRKFNKTGELGDLEEPGSVDGFCINSRIHIHNKRRKEILKDMQRENEGSLFPPNRKPWPGPKAE